MSQVQNKIDLAFFIIIGIRRTEERALFSPYSRNNRSRASVTSREVQKRFFALGSPNDVRTPSSDLKLLYQENDLGEKIISFREFPLLLVTH
jgi:hypothetical protein